MKQKENESLADYKSRFIQEVKVLKLAGGDSLFFPFYNRRLMDMATVKGEKIHRYFLKLPRQRKMGDVIYGV